MLLSFYNVSGQDYRTVIPLQAQFFQDQSHASGFGWLWGHTWPDRRSAIEVAYFDSSVTGVNETTRFTFHTWRDTLNTFGADCVEENGPAWIGSRMIEMTNGMNYFFNGSGDTIRIKTNAAVHTSWNLFDLPNHGFIAATVDSIIWMQQSGLNDSIKNISLLAYDSLGNIISNNVNGKTILLSKSNGFFTLPSFREFPNFIQLYLRQPVPMPVQSQVYDYNVNDEFEFENICTDFSFFTYVKKYTYYLILAKNVSGNSVTYHRQVVNVQVFPDTIFSSYQDSVILPYSNVPLYSTYPEENIIAYTLRQDPNVCNDRPVYTNSNWIWFSAHDSCYLINHFEPTFTIEKHSPGLGMVYQEFNDLAIGLEDCVEELRWYHKGSETWGNFLSLVSGINESQSHNAIIIYPSPVTGICEILFSKKFKGKILMTDISGRIIIEKTIDNTFARFDLATIYSGIYLFSFINDSGIIVKKIVKE